MANASKKTFGAGVHGKGDGTGAMSDISPEKVPENMPLSNRDKTRHVGERGHDGKNIMTEQMQDHADNRLIRREKDADDEQ